MQIEHSFLFDYIRTNVLFQEAIFSKNELQIHDIHIQYFRCLEIKTNQGVVSLPVHQILYIEVFNKVCLVHTKKNTFHTYSSLDSLFELLDSHTFMRAQRSYIVNMNNIESFYFDHIVLSNGKEIMLSRNTRSELKKQYQQFLFRLARRESH